MPDARIAIESATSPGHVRRVDRARYTAMCDALTAVLPAQPPGVTVADARAALLPRLPGDLFPGGDKAGWWLKAVQLDFEAKGTIGRAAGKPVRLFRRRGRDRAPRSGAATHANLPTAGEKTMTPSVRSPTLKMPGARIYHEIRGAGPMLLLISGGPTDAGVFAGLATRLADRYTVVAYDPRGNSRSTFDGPPQQQRLDVHGDDAARLIEALGGGGPAFVFGNSGGAQIGLELAARHAGKVRVLVAHEPPCLMLLDDPSKEVADNEAIRDTYRREGIEAAMRKFMAIAGLDRESGEAPAVAPTAEAMETFGRIRNNFEYFIAHGLMPLSLYRPDVAALKAGSVRVVVAVGEETAGEIANRTGVALAEKLGITPVKFPGDHNGYAAHPAEFAQALHRALGGSQA